MFSRFFPVEIHPDRRPLVLIVTLALLVSHSGSGTVDAQTLQPKISPSLAALLQADPLQVRPVILEMDKPTAPFRTAPNQRLAERAVAILQANGRAAGGLSIIGAAAGWANAAGVQAMSLLPEVAAIHEDAAVEPGRPSTAGPTWTRGRVSSAYVQEVAANRVWRQGGSGRGVTVAVLDSGVAADPDLTQSGNRLLASVSFAGAKDPQHLDRGGHGTHVAGIVAGDGARSNGEFVGMAPRANVVDVQVLNEHGAGRLSSVIRGIEWVLAHRSQYGIRVINLSFGAPTQNSYRQDPLAAAVEIAWKRGLVVVAAAGNHGPASGTVESPGLDPYVITVGATDDQATLTLDDDTLAWFSAWGTPRDSTAKPDLVAPGRRIVSIRVPSSTLDRLLPDHVESARNGSTYFRLSGTSMSTPVVSGALALLLERQPHLTPDQVKAILRGTAQPFGQNAPAPPPGSIGSGLLDAFAATNSGNRGVANQGLRPADAFARTLYPIVYGQPLAWKDPTYLGQLWPGLTWALLSWSEAAWTNYVWDGVAWDNIAWDNLAWDNLAWDNIAWDQGSWDNIAWDNIAWD